VAISNQPQPTEQATPGYSVAGFGTEQAIVDCALMDLDELISFHLYIIF